MDAQRLEIAFQTFLQEMYEIGWIQNCVWKSAASLDELRVRMGDTSRSGYTRSHKNYAPHSCVGVVAEVSSGALLGIDLELYAERLSFVRNREALLRRMNLSSKTSSRELLEEWSIREACYKALSQYGEREHPELNWRKIRRINNHEAEFVVNGARVSLLQTRHHWADDWLLCFARVVEG